MDDKAQCMTMEIDDGPIQLPRRCVAVDDDRIIRKEPIFDSCGYETIGE